MAETIIELIVWASGLSASLALKVVLALVILWLVHWQRKSWTLRHIPGPKANPIFHALTGLSAEERVIQLYRFSKMGEIVKFWTVLFYTCMVNSARGVETILTSGKYIDKGVNYDFMRDWLGDGLLTSTGSKWHSRRKLLTPAFHFKILEDFVEVFNTQSKILVKRLEKKADGKPFDLALYIRLCTLDIICETAMGRAVNAQGNSDSEYVQAITRLSKLMEDRFFTPWLRPDWLYNFTAASKEYNACLKILHDMSQETIEERRALLLNSKENEGKDKEEKVFGKKQRLAFLDLLLEYSEGDDNFTNKDIREEVDTFMFEGHDTTTSAINFTLYLLGCNPEIQAKVHEEMDSIFGDSVRSVTMDDLRSMKLLENCIKEALRLFPSVHRFLRTLKEDVVISDFLVPAGTNLLFFPYALHRDPKQFPDPEKFDPDRFLPENVKHRHPYAYIPFSAGPRNCIGQKFALMEMKVVLSSIFRKFRVESLVPREELQLIDDFMLRIKGGNILKFFQRSSS